MNARKFFTAAVIAAGALSLAACGGGEAEPAPTVTVTAEPEPQRVETREVEVTPQSCLDALDVADESFSIISEIMTAIQNLDTAEIERLTATLRPDEYNALKLECQLSGEL